MANDESKKLNFLPRNLTYHRSAQLIIFIIAFFVCVTQWLAYYARITPDTSDASLWTILSYVSLIAVGAALFTYIFNMAKITFYWSYYITSGVFLVFAIALDFWTQDFSDSASYLLYFPVLYTIFLLALCIIHILQLALSLKAESTVLVPK